MVVLTTGLAASTAVAAAMTRDGSTTVDTGEPTSGWFVLARGFSIEHWYVLAGFAVWLLSFALLVEGIRFQRWAAGFLTRTTEQAVAVASVMGSEEHSDSHLPRAIRTPGPLQDPLSTTSEGEEPLRSRPGLLGFLALIGESSEAREEERRKADEEARQRPPEPQDAIKWAIAISLFVLLVGAYGITWASAGFPVLQWTYENPRQLIAWPLVGSLAPAVLAILKFSMARSFAHAAKAAGALPSRVPGTALAGMLVSAVNFAGAIASLIALGIMAF